MSHGVARVRRSVVPPGDPADELIDGGVPLRTLLALGVGATQRRHLRREFVKLPISENLFGGTIKAQGSRLVAQGATASDRLVAMLPVTTPLLAALINYQQALDEFGICAHKDVPLVLSEPPVTAVGTCLHKNAAEVMKARRLGHCPGEQPVLCGDGVCRDTFIDCFRVPFLLARRSREGDDSAPAAFWHRDSG